jgi:hypothetical protein
MCLARVFAPLQAGMTTPDVVLCPDGHFRQAIYSIGPYIADYPEQVWLAGIVQGWCPKYVSLHLVSSTVLNPVHPDAMRNLEIWMTRMRTVEPMKELILSLDVLILALYGNEHGIRSDVVVRILDFVFSVLLMLTRTC